MEYKIPVKSRDYHKALLMVLNFNLNLSNLELDIVSTLLNYNIEVVDIEAREIIRKELDKGKFNINNYIARLKDKGILIVKPADKALYVNPMIMDIVRDNKVSFEFEIADDNNV